MVKEKKSLKKTFFHLFFLSFILFFLCFSFFFFSSPADTSSINNELFQFILISGQYGQNGAGDSLENAEYSGSNCLSVSRRRKTSFSSSRLRNLPVKQYFCILPSFFPVESFSSGNTSVFYFPPSLSSFLFIRAGPEKV